MEPLQPDFSFLNAGFQPIQPPQNNAPVTTTVTRTQQPGPVRTNQNTQAKPPVKTNQKQPPASIAHDITHNDITNFLGGIVKQTAKGAAQFGNQAVQEGKQVYDTGRMEVGNATHNNVAAGNAEIASQHNYAGFGNKGGIGNQGTITTRQEAQTGSTHGALKIAGDAAMLGSWLIPGAGKAVDEAGTQIAKPLFTRIGENMVTGAKAGAMYGAGSSAYQGDKAKQIAENTVINAGAGALLGGGGTALAAGAKAGARAGMDAGRKAAPVLKDILNNRPELIHNEIGGGQLSKTSGGAEPIDGYTHSSDLVKDYANDMRTMDQTSRGGIKLPGEDGGMTRGSEHTQFYREFYKTNGKAPAIADYQQEALNHLESGKAAFGASDTYKALKARESTTADINSQPATSTPPADAKTPYDTPEIIKMRQEQSKIPSTHTDMTPERQALRDKVGQILYQQGGQSDAEKAPYNIATSKQAHIVLGAPASGKSNIVNPLLQDHAARLIDSDEAKALLGDVNQAGALHQESDGIVTDQMLRAAKRGENMVIPLVGKNPDRVGAAIDALRNQNYDVHLHYNHLDPALAAQRAVTRFQESGRFVDPDYVMNTVGLRPQDTYGILKNNEGIKSYRAYDNNVPFGQKPRLVEEAANSGVSTQPDNAGRSLRESNGQETPKPTQTQTVNEFDTKAMSADKAGMRAANPTAADLRAQYAKDMGVNELTPEQLANLSPEDQMKLYEAEKPTQKNVELTPAQIKAADARNPVKVESRYIDPNSKTRFQDARGEVAGKTHPITIATDVAAQSAKKAGFKTAFDLGDRVEHPESYPDMANRGGKMTPQRQAVEDYKHLTNLISATSHSQGGKDAYLNNFVKHAVDTEKWTNSGESPVFDAKTGKLADPANFRGIDAISRKTDANGNIVYPDMRSLHNANMKLQNEDNVDKFIRGYGGAAAYKTEKQAITKAFSEADGGATAGRKTEPLGLGDEKPLMLSKEAYKEANAYLKSKTSIAGKIIDKPTAVAKQVLLSTSQYHPININVLQAAPYLVGKGRPDQSFMGLVDTARNAVDTGHALAQERADLHSGLIEKSARIGAPLYKSDFDTGSTIGGGKMVFGREIPAMQRRVNAVTIKSLERRNIDLGSAKARSEGDTANSIMGFYNNAMHNTNPNVQKWISRFLLAPNFEESKLNILKTIVDPRASAMARVNALTAVAGKYAAEVGLAVGLGKLFGQTHDSIKDTLKREAISPEIPTPFKNNSGSTIKFKIPDTGESEIINLALNEGRNKQGQITVKPNKPGQIVSNVATDVRDKFAPTFSAGVDLATNKNYEGNNIYQPQAQAGVKAQQAATNLTTGFLPIGVQGLPDTKFVESHLPGNVQNVINENKPKTNAFLKSAASTVTATPETDTTTGKGLETQQYYSALDKAKGSLVAGSPAEGAFLENFGITKDPVTGKYLMTPNSEMTVAKASSLNAYPEAATAANQMAKTLAADGQKVDPYYLLTPAQQKAYNAYETMAPRSGDRTDWENKNNSWYQNFANKQSAFFSSLPKGDPNKPANPIKYPTPSAAVTKLQNAYNAIPASDTVSRNNFLTSNPDLVNQWTDQANYDNAVRVARGYAPIKQTPNATPQVTAFTKAYTDASKADRSAMRSSNPEMYQSMIAQYDNQDLASVDKQAAVSQLAGEPDYTSKELKDMSSLSSDVYQTGTSKASGSTPSSPTYSIVPAGWMDGLNPLSSSGSSSSSSGSSSSSAQYNSNYAIQGLQANLLSDLSKMSSDLKGSQTMPKARTISYKTTPIKTFKASEAKAMHIKNSSVPKGPKPAKIPKVKIKALSKYYTL